MSTVFLFLLACSAQRDPAGLGGQDWDLDGENVNEGDSTADVTPLDFALDTQESTQAASPSDSDACVEDTGLATSLDATATGGVIDVVHGGVVGDCCAAWEITGELGDEGVIWVWYENTARQTCDCDCAQVLVYAIDNVPKGTWEIRADGDSTTVRVP